MNKVSDSIYYYTSNYVFIEWLKNEKIWATRSVSSNDSEDTVYATKHFDELKKLYDQKYYKNFDDAKDILYITKNLSLRVYKDILKDFIKNHYEQFLQIVIKSNQEYRLFNAPVKLTKEGLELLKQCNAYEDCGNGNIRIIARGNDKEEIFYKNILSKLSIQEIEQYLQTNININRNLIEDLPILLFPYVICFSFNKDDRFLWDSYTSNQGVCLEFSKNELNEYWRSKEFNKKNHFAVDLLEPILYTDTIQKQYIKKWMDIMVTSNKPIRITEILSFIAVLCKSAYWKPENECRAVFGAKYFSDERFVVKENYNLKYSNGYKTQDYIEVLLPKKLLKSVTTGPLNSINDLNYYVENELKNSGIDKDTVERLISEYDRMNKYSSSGQGILKK